MEIELRGRTKTSSRHETMWWNSETSVLSCSTNTHRHTHLEGLSECNDDCVHQRGGSVDFFLKISIIPLHYLPK